MNLIWNLLAMLISLTCSIFYKKHKIKNKQFLLTKRPAVIAFNHPNAFMDSVSFSIFAYPARTYFLARGDVFKPGFATWFFESLGIAPIFRIQDEGKEGLKKNDETYRRVNRLLKHRRKIAVYAEGLCVQERRLRPLKKGVPRMVFGAMEEINDPDFVVIPVGINYSDPKKFRSTVFFNVGEPMRVADYMEQYHEQPARTMNKFLHELEPKMKELIMHINNPKNDGLIAELEEMLKKDMTAEMGLSIKDLEHDYLVSKKIVETINAAGEKDPSAVADLKEKCDRYFKKLKQLKVRDWLVDPVNDKKLNRVNATARCLLLLMGFPFYLRGLLGNYLPYKLAGKITPKIAKNVEFHASLGLGIGSFLFLIFYIIQFVIAYLLAPHIGWALLVITHSFVTGLFSLYYHPFKQKTAGLLRMLKNKTELDQLRKSRQEIKNSFAAFNSF